MSEYIEREALLKDISESVVFTVKGDSPSLEIRGANKVIDRIKSAPTADVVEVIRCKDCEYYETKNSLGTQGICMCGEKEMNYAGEFYPYENDFCSYGVRKEGAESGSIL